MEKKQKRGVLMTVLNRDVWEGFDAIQGLTSRGWGDASVALALGRTGRRLRDKRDEIEDSRQMLIKKYGEKVENGSLQITAKGQEAFVEEWRKLLMTSVELEVFPISLTAVMSREKLCETCKRGPLNDIPAASLDVLVHIGIVTTDE